MKNKLGILEIKQELWNQKFRDLFPELKAEIDAALKDPGCTCNMKLYHKIMQCKDRVQRYFPNKVIETPQEMAEKLSQNNWVVINCSIQELEGKLRQLGPGRKIVSLARFQDKITAVINSLDVLW